MHTNRSEYTVNDPVSLPLVFPQPDLDGSQRAVLLHTLLLWLPRILAIAYFYANLHSHISLESQGMENCPLSQPPPFQSTGYRVPGLACPESLHALSPGCQMQSDHSGIISISSRSCYLSTYFTIIASIVQPMVV